jgi:hypothetical protein
MSRFIIKHLRWKKEWGEVGSPYDYGCSDNTNYTRITDPNLPRVGEFFTDENGVTYLHTYKNGTHAYVKTKVDGAKNIFSERSYDADFIQERKSLEEVKVFDEDVKCISSLENEYIAILASDDEGDFVEFQNFKDFFCKEDASVSLGGTENYLFRLDSAAKAIYLCRTVRGLTLLVHYANNSLGFFCYDILLDQESQFNPENVGFYPVDITATNIPASASYIVQLSEDGQFMFFDDVITEINLNPSEVGDITTAAGSPISVVAKPLVKSLSKAWQKEYTHRLDSADGSARHFVIPVHSGNTTKVLVYNSGESDKWQIKTLKVTKNYGADAICSVIGLSKFIVRDGTKTTAYKLGLNDTSEAYEQNLPDAEILIDDSDYQYSRISGKLFEERCSVSALRKVTNGYSVDNITVADTKANASGLNRNVFSRAVFGASISNITYLGLGYVTVVGSNAANTTTVVANTGFVSSIENINVEEINAERITVRDNEGEFSDGVTIDHDSMDLKNGNNEITLNVGKDDQTDADKVTLKVANNNASSSSEITEDANENKIVSTSKVNAGEKPEVTETVTVKNSIGTITESKTVVNTKEEEAIKNGDYERVITSENNNNTSKLTESVTSGNGASDEGVAERELAKRRNNDIGSEDERGKGSFVRETVGSNDVTLERAANLGNSNGNVHETVTMKTGSAGFEYTRSLEAEKKITETYTTEEISKTSTVGGSTVITETASGSNYSNTAVNGNKKISDSFDSNSAARSAELSNTQYVKETANSTSSSVDVKNGTAQVEVKASGTNGADNDINMHLPDTNTREVVDRAGTIKTADGSAVSGDTFSNYKIYMRKNDKTYETSISSLENYIRRVKKNRIISDENGILEDDPDFGWIHCICTDLNGKYIKLIEVTLPPTSNTEGTGSTINFDLCMGSAGETHEANVTLSMRYSSSGVNALNIFCGSIKGRGRSDIFESLLKATSPTDNYAIFPYARRESNQAFTYGLAIHVGTLSSLKWTLLGIKFNCISENNYSSIKVINKLTRNSSNNTRQYIAPASILADFKLTESEAIVASLSSDITNNDVGRFSDGSAVFGPNGIGRDVAQDTQSDKKLSKSVVPIYFDSNGIPHAASRVYTQDAIDSDFVRIDKFAAKGYLLYGTGVNAYAGLPPKTDNNNYYLKCNGSNVSWEAVTFPNANDVVRKDSAGSSDFHIIQANNSTWKKVDHPSGNGKYYLSVTNKYTFAWDDASQVLKRQTKTENSQVKDVDATKDDCILVKKNGETSTKRISTNTSDNTKRYLSFRKNTGYSWETAADITGSLSSYVKVHNGLNGATSQWSENLMGEGGQVTLTSDFFLDIDRKANATSKNSKIAFFKFRTDNMKVDDHWRFAEVNFYCGFMIVYFRQADATNFPYETSDDGKKWRLKSTSFTALYNFLKNKNSNVIKEFTYQYPGTSSVQSGLSNFDVDDFLEKVNNYHSTKNVLFYADVYHFKRFFLQAYMNDGSTHGDAIVQVFMMINRSFYEGMPIYPWTTFETEADCKFVIDRDRSAYVHWNVNAVGTQSSFGDNQLGYVPSGKLAAWFRDPWWYGGMWGRYKGDSGSSSSTYSFSFKMTVEEQGSGYKGKYKLVTTGEGESTTKYF